MPVTISVSETKYMGLLTPSADEPPIWGVVFQINREDGIGTAIGVTVRCDDKANAPEQALSKLRGFLSEASAAAEALTLSSPEPVESEVLEASNDQASEKTATTDPATSR
jgi:hypothetical protein